MAYWSPLRWDSKSEGLPVWEPVGELDLALNGPFSIWLLPAVSTIKLTSPAATHCQMKKLFVLGPTTEFSDRLIG